MKKVLLVVDGTNFSDSAFEFVRRLNELQPVLVTGVFVPQTDYANLWSFAAAAGSGGVFVPLLEDEASQEVAKNISLFEERCCNNDIRYRVHKDFYEFALPELRKESRFADIMVLSGELFYKEMLGANQYDYMQTALHQSECPALIVPENMAFPTTNILAYDGSRESVYAIKQFAYLFPELAANRTLLVYAESKEDRDFPARESIVELATQHYPDLTFYKMDVNPRKYFTSWIADQKGALLVSGSFGRSTLSQAFKKSFVADIIKEHRVPVFIAHK